MSVSKSVATVVWAAAMFFAAATSPVEAAAITFNTTGEFSTTGTNVLTFASSDIVVTFTGVTETVNVPPDWYGIFGTFTVTGDNPATGNQTLGFDLTVTQTAPGGGPLAFPATYSGNINVNNSTVVITFSSPLVQSIGGISYEVTTGVLNLPAPSKSPNSVTIGGRVYCEDCGTTVPQAAVPEPASLFLMGSGLAAVAARLRRRKK